MQRPDGGDVDGRDPGCGPEEAAEEHAWEDAVIALAKGAAEGGQQDDHLPGECPECDWARAVAPAQAPQKPQCNTDWHGCRRTERGCWTVA